MADIRLIPLDHVTYTKNIDNRMVTPNGDYQDSLLKLAEYANLYFCRHNVKKWEVELNLAIDY